MHMKNTTITPVIWTGVYPHMPIAVTTSVGQFVTRASRLPTSLSHLANDRPMHYRFFTIDLWGLPMGQSSPNLAEDWSSHLSPIVQNFRPITQTVYEVCVTKVFFNFLTLGLTPGPKFTTGDKTCNPPSSTILPNFIAVRQPTPEISVTKVCGQTNSKDISPHAEACGDNKGFYNNLNRPGAHTWFKNVDAQPVGRERA